MVDRAKTLAFIVKRGPLIARWVPPALLALALVSLAAFAFAHAPTRALWFDEYATLYFADPATAPTALLADTHPPLYYMLVRAGQMLGLSEQAALWGTNALAIAGFSALAYVLLARAGRPRFALVAIAAALASPAALTFALEGRNYAMAQFACLALTAAALAREDKPFARRDGLLAGLAALCAAVHLYGALYAGALGAALTLMALARKRRPDLIRGLIVGASATAIVAIWLVIAAPVLFGGQSLVGWIPNTLRYTIGQFWFFNKALSGFGPNAFVLIAGLGLALWLKPARTAAALFALTAALFAALPVIASLFMPMLAGRYLAIAAPALLMLALHAAWCAVAPFALTQPRLRAAAFCSIALYALIAALFAHPVAARLNADNRYPWHGADARAALGTCATPAVRVWVPDLPKVGAVDQQALYLAAYRRALGRADVALDPSAGAPRDVADYPCGLIAWGEHTTTFDLQATDEAGLLRELKLANAAGAPLSLIKHKAGFVLVRAR